tara:strand:+ start:33 stop:1244 length:1212 start_codon:yes stop_codon:yes gene_type:complete
MKELKSIFFTLLFIFLSIGVRAQSNKDFKVWASQGNFENNHLFTEIPFQYIDNYIFVEIIQNDKSFNFLFDTGADVTVINESILNEFDFKSVGEMKISGPLVGVDKKKKIVLSSLNIAGLKFSNIGAISIDLKFPEKKYCNVVHGIIGSTVIKKAKWQINYKKQTIIVANDINDIDTDNAVKIKMGLPSNGWGADTIELKLDGVISDFVLDTGNGRNKMVSHPIYFSRLLRNNPKTNYGLFKSENDYDLIIKEMRIGDIVIKNQLLSLEWEVGNNLKLLGNKFLEDYLVTLDSENHLLYLESINEIKEDELFGFEIGFTPNFLTNKIEVKRGLKKFSKKNRIKKGAILLAINGQNVVNLSNEQFCEFWRTTWKEIMNENKVRVLLKQGRRNKEYILTKKELTE